MHSWSHSTRKGWINHLCVWLWLLSIVLVAEATTTLLRRPKDSSTHDDTEKDDEDPSADLAVSLQRFLAVEEDEVDPVVVQRFEAVPAGFRKHPSYYSETYLRRAARPTTPEQQAARTAQWGQWTYIDSKASTRPTNELYTQYSHRDVPRARFPSTAWQTDVQHLSQFLPQALQLTERALEAILAEYGRGPDDLPNEDFATRSRLFQPSAGGGGGGTITKASYDGLKRRLLHAVMTEDRFTIAMAGHSAAAGHGNHFPQTYTIQMQRILEPILARLGVKVSARNFGMGGLGTLHNAVAAGDLYGHDVDVLLWDSGMTEREPEARGILSIQALVGMDRAPLLWYERDSGNVLGQLQEITGANTALYGKNFANVLGPPVENVTHLQDLPWAIQYLKCPEKTMKDACRQIRYNGTCWIDRSDYVWHGVNLSYTPTAKLQDVPGGRAGWHPGNREHQLIGRSMTFTILLALRDVLQSWNNQAPHYVLDDSEWHVTAFYKGIQDQVVAHREEWMEWCTKKGIPTQFCYYPAKGRTENTPRTRPWATSLRSIMEGSEHNQVWLAKNDFDPPDVYNPTLFPPPGQMDVLAIVEAGVPFAKNLARVHDSAQNMQGRVFTEPHGAGSKHHSGIAGGRGWQFQSESISAGSDNCDGEHDSWCRRIGEQCPLYGHNDGRLGLFFDGFSGWMIFRLPQVEQGLVMIKLHSWAFFPPQLTEKWCSENNVVECTGRNLMANQTQQQPQDGAVSTSVSSSSSSLRQLKPKVPEYCEEFKFEFAIDGVITSWNKTEFVHHQRHAQRVVEFWPLLQDDTWEGPKDVELAIRTTGCGRQKPLDLTHIYWI